MGKLVRSAKPYHAPPSEKQMVSAAHLAGRYEQFIRSHPSYMRSDFFIPVPSSSKKPFDLPTFLVEQLCVRLNIKNGIQYVTRAGNPKPMKDYKTVKDKSDNIRGTFKITDSKVFDGCLVTVIDDIYESGATLHELGITLQEIGATVQGLVATKTLKNPS
jgi:predicted amidophosphoribosyltransferase